MIRLPEYNFYSRVDQRKNVITNMLEVSNKILDNHKEDKTGRIKRNRKQPTYINQENIDHSFNSHGFRGPEIDLDKESVVFLGCSYTEGVGLDYSHTWASFVSTHFKDLQQINAGIAGADTRAMYKALSTVVHDVKANVKMVVALAPDFCRRTMHIGENFDSTNLQTVTPMDVERIGLNKKQKEFYKDYLLAYRDINAYLDYVDSLNMMMLLCKSNDIDFYWTSWSGSQKKNIKVTAYQNNEVVSKNLTNLEFVDLIFSKEALPHGLYDCYIDAKNLISKPERFEKGCDINDEFWKPFPDLLVASDYIHPSPNWHYHTGNYIANEISKRL